MRALRKLGFWAASVVFVAANAFALNCRIEISLAAERPVDGYLHNFSRDAVVYLAEALSSSNSIEIQGDALSVSTAELPQSVAEALTAVEKSHPGSWSHFFSALKSLSLENWYNARREARVGYLLPEAQADFLEGLGIQGNERPFWREVRFRSRIKPEVRSVYRSMEGNPTPAFPAGLPRISLATSAVNPFGDETEVIIQRAESKAWDFYTYRRGKLVRQTEIITSTGNRMEAASPYSCLACHYNPFNRTFGRAPVNFVHGYSEMILSTSWN
ncbi:MAG: hypothetical protein KDD51_03235 [Bdellovibrionales bacterium]|nr:hypothetical protein [Bdellovibrionales bacterium]